MDTEFSKIYRQHFDYVRFALRRFGVVVRDLDDVTQDVFVVVHRRLHTFEAGRPLKPWLLGISRRVARDERKRARHHREIMQDDIRDVCPKRGPEARVMAARGCELVQQALTRLPEDQRQVLLMRDALGMSIPEISRELGLGVNTLYARLRLGKTKFRRAWRVVSSPARPELSLA